MSDSELYSHKKIAQIFNAPISKTALFQAERGGEIDPGQRFKQGAINLRGWPLSALPKMGEMWGKFKKFSSPKSLAIFTTKGGVLKTTLSFNLARYAALHNLKVCVVGLDMQGDITTCLGHNQNLNTDENGNLDDLIEKLNQTKGLSDIFNKRARLSEVILPTEIPTLFYIPETPELAALNEFLGHTNRREYWLSEKVIQPLKNHFDLVIMDCSPNWNRLITNALVSCDALLSPLECKINNFRNFQVFEHFLKEFKREMHLDFNTIFIPTRFGTGRKLSMDIKNRYQTQLPECTKNGIKESTIGEEAQALKLSIPEFAPAQKLAGEIRDLLSEVHDRIDMISSSPRKSVMNQSQQIDKSSNNPISNQENEWPFR